MTKNLYKRLAFGAAVANFLLGCIPPINGASLTAWVCAAICLWLGLNYKSRI